ncbi:MULTISPECIES: aminotransferase class I/II-fold pyridoxal phosphate-dependent enzyme [unclassified Cryobacterium]|uniref:aminotransferase class I/II-fold pyridoxal phosphate-dependent enzyme n=1 Tax=unclassified Cryobacterium TaxID=2649013 RepID=UPI00106BEF51|nr:MULTISPECIES: aminotransferase class I/II-fold pyridoxal phosphate-dependent enzyme [unclassified Cryobacterium]TFC56060.1 aminotransferase class I/II-fold pyridoxal phosphate-dependent enzyme [Cryobacterium sp. TMB3-1-2]TFC69706.1 aminotransferase class I/II-fold pyridoxal phosphate-dependent enzyme [Cryobacterium sp. TMB3-15]TFC78072.1 aminotransferase class I/II-fold pyridoxal phosphate-dependent enzyme [Cryobacterium sp. TMB3-10]TFC84835.1 aminotransferase class I/II-fold pyridoxal phosp
MTIGGAWRRTARGAGLLAADGTVSASIFAEMSALAMRTGAINLGQGFPDEDGPAVVLEAARQAIRDGVNQYPPGRGAPVLLEAIARHQQRFYGLTVDPGTEVLVTAGATEALSATLLALLEPGDEVVTFEPFYDAYGGLIALAGGVHQTVRLHSPDFQPDLDELAAVVTDRTRIILINNPHNPTGTVFTRETLELIVALAHKHDALIVTDEVYEHLTFGVAHLPVATLPGARERTVTISSAGKTFSTTGWKIGWLSAPAAIVTAILAVKQFLTYVNGAPFQPATAIGLDLPDAYYSGIASDLQAKRDVLAGGLGAAGFTLAVPQGSYFIVADAAPLGHPDAVEFCRALPDLAGVVGIPISAFCLPEHKAQYASLVRFAFCKRVDVLEDAAARLAHL